MPLAGYLAVYTFVKAKNDSNSVARADVFEHVTRFYYSVRGGLIDLFPMGSTLPVSHRFV